MKLKQLCIAVLVYACVVSLVACSNPGGPARDMQTVVILEASSENGSSGFVRGFKEAMTELGYVEGENITYLQGDSSRLLAFEAYVARDFDAYLVFRGTSLLELLDEKNDDLPIVAFNILETPRAEQFVDADGYPTGQFTGAFAEDTLSTDFMRLLVALDPDIETIYIPLADADLTSLNAMDDLDALAQELGVTLRIDDVEVSEIDAAIADLPAIDVIFTLAGEHEERATCRQWRVAAAERGVLYQGLNAHLRGCEPIFRDLPGSEQGTAAPHDIAAEQMDLLLKGTPVTDIPFVVIQEGQISVNEEMVNAAGFTIDEAFLTEYNLVLFDESLLPGRGNRGGPDGDGPPDAEGNAPAN